MALRRKARLSRASTVLEEDRKEEGKKEQVSGKKAEEIAAPKKKADEEAAGKKLALLQQQHEKEAKEEAKQWTVQVKPFGVASLGSELISVALSPTATARELKAKLEARTGLEVCVLIATEFEIANLPKRLFFLRIRRLARCFWWWRDGSCRKRPPCRGTPPCPPPR